ncbi:MAG: hypothetical protein HQL25_02180 [Candidatus Omnitrophica bacterium]|nr:hypothetical protein [Candidatus Omnitrophota bacterium]
MQTDNREPLNEYPSKLPFKLEALTCPHANPRLKQVFLTLLNTVKTTFNTIEPENIKNSLKIIINEFKNSAYNDLLLYTYAITEDNYIPIHIANNVIFSIAFGNYLRLSDEDLLDLGLVAFCHDFGMMEYSNIVQAPNQLSKDERNLVQKHPLKSVDKFQNVFSEKIMNAIMEIHETVDGRGYPLKKSALEISIFAKIVSICDVFASLTHARNFRASFSPYEAIKMIINKKNLMFDERLLKKFIEYTSIYPIGSFLLLNTGQTALVIANDPPSPTHCIIRILLLPNNKVDPMHKIVSFREETLIYVTEALNQTKKEQVVQLANLKGIFLNEK